MCNLVFTFKIRIYLFHKKPFFQKNNTWRRTCLFNCHFLMLNCLLFIQPPKNLCFVTPLTLFVLSSATDEFLKYILDKKVCSMYQSYIPLESIGTKYFQLKKITYITSWRAQLWWEVVTKLEICSVWTEHQA